MLRESSTRVEAMLSDLSSGARPGPGRDGPLAGSWPRSARRSTSTRCWPGRSRRREHCSGWTRRWSSSTSEERGPLLATVGLSEAEAAAASPGVAPDWGRTRAAVVSYLYGPRTRSSSTRLRGSVAVPMRGEADDTLGTLWVFWRASERDPERDTGRAARGARAASRAGDRERAPVPGGADSSPTSMRSPGLHNYRYFHETLAREVARAHRYDRRLALVVFDIDDFKAINDRIGHLAGDSVLAEAAERVRSVVRGADIACRVGGDEFAVILPESTISDAESLYRRLQGAISNWRSAGSEPPSLGRHRRARGRRRRRDVLQAGRRSALPREGARQGPGDRRPGGGVRAAVRRPAQRTAKPAATAHRGRSPRYRKSGRKTGAQRPRRRRQPAKAHRGRSPRYSLSS